MNMMPTNKKNSHNSPLGPTSQDNRHSQDRLIEQRLRAAYGYGISDSAIRYVSKMDAMNGVKKIDPGSSICEWSANPTKLDHKPPYHLSGKSSRRILGRDVDAAAGQIVRHAGNGSHPHSQFDGDYLSGGEEGYVLDVCGDYAQVRWKNGSVRFYYVGRSPWRPDSNGNDTKNPRAIRCLALVTK